ncbi:integral membrane sensor signal transduction histidine kinase [Flexistipes sinusarabici DSM 4947]|uniref:histidine kinase n=2 Tax=Flexistipes sinusarabici TaxID=2352 RepID=F8E6F9_FLESM|nr:integral membrane sensor signal transduction histidine kinase [Flexistipes sinusarabici DSM 4947]
MEKSQGNKLTFINSKFFLFVVVFEVLILFLLINNQFFPLYLAFLTAQFFFFFTTAVCAKKLHYMKTETQKCLSNYHKRISEDERYIYELQKENEILKKGKEQSSRLNHRQNSLTMEQENLFSIMAHELRNPLNSMIGFSSIMLNEEYKIDENELKEIICIIHNSSRKLLCLIDNIIHISTDKYTSTSLSSDYCDISHVLQAVSSIAKGLTKKGENISFKGDINDNLPEVYADESVLGKVLSDIIEHFVYYSVNGEIVLKTVVEKNYLSIQVGSNSVSERLKDALLPFIDEEAAEREKNKLSSAEASGLTKIEFIKYSLSKMDALISTDTYSGDQAALAIKLKIKG